MSTPNPFSFLEERADAVLSMASDTRPSTWSSAIESISELGRWTLLGVLLTVLALRFLDLVEAMAVPLVRPLLIFAAVVAAIRWLGIGPADLAILLP